MNGFGKDGKRLKGSYVNDEQDYKGEHLLVCSTWHYLRTLTWFVLLRDTHAIQLEAKQHNEMKAPIH